MFLTESYFLNFWSLKADVNAVTFADEASDVLYSGSDDSLCKVRLIFPNFIYSFFKDDSICICWFKSDSNIAGLSG